MKVDRLVSMLLLLLEKERISAGELAARFEVSLRTVYRDIDNINLAGIPIRSIPGVGGGFEIMPNYKIDKNVFSATDLSTILTGLSGLSDIMPGNELVNALVKVKSFIPKERAKDIELKTNQILIDLSPWQNNRNVRTYLEIIKTAIQENKLLAFEYWDRHGNKISRQAEPYQLVIKNSNWYWQGYCRLRNDFRMFKLSRITNLEMLEESFTPRGYEKPQLDVSEIAENRQITIKIRINRSIMERVLDFCGYENFSEESDEHYLVDYPFIENDYYYGILLSFGDKCECLEPLQVRTMMKKKIQDLAAIYQNSIR